jgi:hypothetical protein
LAKCTGTGFILQDFQGEERYLDCIKMVYEIHMYFLPVLRIRIISMQIRILFTLIRILFTLIRILFTLIRILFTLIRIRFLRFTQMQIRFWIRIRPLAFPQIWTLLCSKNTIYGFQFFTLIRIRILLSIEMLFPDPDPAFHFDPDPYPASQYDPDPQHCF